LYTADETQEESGNENKKIRLLGKIHNARPRNLSSISSLRERRGRNIKDISFNP